MDFFLLLSSICGIVGKESQANYAAGNSYMDALAHYRVSNGEKAVSLDLGLMEQEGLLAENASLMAKLKAPGYWIPILSNQLHALLDCFCDPELGTMSHSDCQIVVGIETPANLYSKGLQPAYWMSRPTYSHMFQIGGTEHTSHNSDPVIDYARDFSIAGSLADAEAIVVAALVKKMSKSLCMAEEDIDAQKRLHLCGVDSLVAVELRNWFIKEFSADVAVFDILGDFSCVTLGALVAGRSRLQHIQWVHD